MTCPMRLSSFFLLPQFTPCPLRRPVPSLTSNRLGPSLNPSLAHGSKNCFGAKPMLFAPLPQPPTNPSSTTMPPSSHRSLLQPSSFLVLLTRVDPLVFQARPLLQVPVPAPLHLWSLRGARAVSASGAFDAALPDPFCLSATPDSPNPVGLRHFFSFRRMRLAFLNVSLLILLALFL